MLTKEAQSFSFTTYAPLRIEEHRCSWSDNNKCRPLASFSIRFNNPIDRASYSQDMLRITPEISGLSTNISGSTIEIGGQTKGRTTYTVSVSGKIQDIFGQRLGADTDLTFEVGTDSTALLVGPGQIFLTLDPAAPKPVFSVYAINYNELHAKIYAVQPDDWPRFKQYLRDWREPARHASMPGVLVSDRNMRLDAATDTLTQLDIGVGEFTHNGFGQFAIIVEPPRALFESDNDRWTRESQTVIAWVQVTQIGLDAFNDYSQMVAWATGLKDGRPLAGVGIRAEANGTGTSTGTDGIARFALPAGATYLVASQGADQAILPRSTYYWGDDAWASYPPGDTLRWYVVDDRQMYRPGEDVHIKGWLRRIGGRQDGDVGLVGTLVDSVHYKISDPQGSALGDGLAKVDAFGGFDFVFSIPQTVNLGTAQISLNAQGGLGGLAGAQEYHSVQIQEFRRPEFEVAASNEASGPFFAGEHALLDVQAKYYAGGGLPNADATWQVTTTPGNYSPPNWPDFTFGTWQPWWVYFDGGYPYPGDGGKTDTFAGKTDASGTHTLRIDFDTQGNPANGPRPFSIQAQATVMDVNRQAWSSSTSLLVHPADVYVGLRTARYFVERGTPLKVDFIVTDLDGKPAADRQVEIRAARLEGKLINGNYIEQEVDVQTCAMVSTSIPGSCSFKTDIGGSYQITALVTDDRGRRNQTRMARWVSGGRQPMARQVEQEKVTLIPDKETYRPGDTAHILVQAPFSPADGLITVSRSGMLSSTHFHIQEGSITLDVPIQEAQFPNLNIQVDLVGAAARTDDQGQVLVDVPARPAYATGQLKLSIPPLQRTLSLRVTPDESELEPGGTTDLAVTLQDASGRPVPGAELAVVVVDEAILALTNYRLADPIAAFYGDRPALLDSRYGRASITLVDPLALASAARDNLTVEAAAVPAPEATSTPGEARGGGSQSQQPAIRVRSDFNPLAVFAPAVHTDANGAAHVVVTVPDNLTRYRVMVVAVDGQGREFGTGESNVTARLPLMVRPSAPRFLNFGDRFELPVVVQNQTGQPMDVSVAVRATNLELLNAGLRVTVPAHDRLELRFPASTRMAGTARIQVAAVSGAYSDAATLELPVYTPASSEAFATYGVIDQGAASQPVLYPSDVFPQYGGLEINTSSTALQALTDAVLYLVAYPYECSEQLASRVLAVASLRDVLTAFKADGLPAPAELDAVVSRDIDRLHGMQNDDGGFPYWQRGFDSVPFNSIHVTHALYRAQQKGYPVPADMPTKALEYLRQIESHYPAWYGQQTRWTLSAYALYVRNLMGDRDTQKAGQLLKEAGLDHLSMQAIGWLWPVIDDGSQLDAIRQHVNNAVVESAGAANFTTFYDDQSYLLLSSDRRTDAVLLDALMADNPKSDLIPKLVNGLLAHRTAGHWDNTQENVFVLLALDHYFNTYEARTPDFVARLWLGSTYAGSNEFHGRTTERQETLIPMDTVLTETAAAGGRQDLILSKEGPGRLYYRLGLRYAPTDLNLKPLDMGFAVQRRYEAIDNPADVSQDADGTWHIKAGARVRVKISMVADNRSYHVALVDPLPAGLEIVNPALAVTGSSPQDPGSSNFRYGWWWWGSWYEHQNLRDDRAEAFTSLLWEGVYEYSYVARATTPGSFVVPPAKAEEMYSPEVFGRSGSDRVIVK